MPYLSLYRKYRPRSLGEIVGQRHVTQTLANAVRGGQITHAYLFAGPRGTGKTTAARALAKSLNCAEGPLPEPCEKCEACHSIQEGTALDVLELDAASNRGIDEIRELRERVKFAPASTRFKVYIVDEVHMLTPPAFNALLKTLEEPPRHVIFVLCTTEPHELPATILSRCQRFDFHRLSVPDLEVALNRVVTGEKLHAEEAAVRRLAEAADGSARDALSLLEQAAAYADDKIRADDVTAILGGIDVDLLLEYTDLCLRGEVAGVFRFVDRVVSEGKDLRQLVAELIRHHRDLLVLAVSPASEELLTAGAEARRKLKAQKISPDEILRHLDLLAAADRELRFTSHPRLVLEMYSVRLCGRPGAPAPAAAPAAPAGERGATSRSPAATTEAPPRPVRPKTTKAEASESAPAAAEPQPAAPAPAEAAARASQRSGFAASQSSKRVTLEAVQAVWPEILDHLARAGDPGPWNRNFNLGPRHYDGRTLSIEFTAEVHRDRLTPSRQQVLQDALEKRLGIRPEIVAEVRPSGADRGRRASAGEKKPEDGPSRAQSFFPGSEIVP
jgi:DNA polymerase-3 subunit gamma/tau